MLLGAFLELPQFLRFSAEDVWCMMDPVGSSTLPCSREDPSTGSLIQANQGHSLKALSCLGRMHIHPALGPQGDSGIISDMWPNCEVAVFITRTLAFPSSALPMGVILTPGNADSSLLPKYFKEALQFCQARRVLSLTDNEETKVSEWPQTQLQRKKDDLTRKKKKKKRKEITGSP
ncbi:tRNA 2'-phosphotransferase 1 [Pteropus alecto]|uniref:tRNA 2'-phosphotransferase 1 n=1 Tax=Pteropus alecto TaxID=9402 RepID=L5K6H4_PTEAL|nr:tRNA 2'-phosphotransferase 1 [Pteropus alecto]